VTHPETGSPQGGVVSPVLANAYLHEVLDTWFEETVKPRLQGRAYLIRYADDAVLVFEREGDARRVLDVLPKRFGKYGLTLHPEKTRLVPFQGLRPGAPPSPREERPGTFDFLGFTHYWGRTLKGTWMVKRKTAKDRFRRSLKAVAARLNRVRLVT
jgi:RNA-directed DNA polymerase